MATAADTFTWATFEAELRAYVGLATGEDANLELWLGAAAADCDNFCGWYYLDDDDVQVDETPSVAEWGTLAASQPLIKLGVYEWVKAAYLLYVSPAAGGLKVVKTDRLQESYQGGDKGITLTKLARATAHDCWQQYKDNLLLL